MCIWFLLLKKSHVGKNYSSTDVADNTAQLHFGLGAGIIYATEPLNKAHQNCESFSGEKSLKTLTEIITQITTICTVYKKICGAHHLAVNTIITRVEVNTIKKNTRI